MAFAIMVIEKTIGFESNEVKLPLRWGSGMIGVIPVFEKKDEAEAYISKYYKDVEGEIGIFPMVTGQWEKVNPEKN